ncbi:MAG TPA: hypothetical protein VLG09_02635 [Candidatus Saccharimonadales bacterium]|nr:hypothetical protein [Candidatus Saccharimonadales bacterium]
MNTIELNKIQIEYFSREGAKLAKGDNIGVGTICYYRGPDGSKCAIGCAIPDELYDPRMEDKVVDMIMDEWDNIHELFADVDKTYLYESQQAHDMSSTTTAEQLVEKLNSLYARCVEGWE